MCIDKIAPVDVEENNIIELQPEVLAGLLKDRTTGKNIIWATDDYSHLGEDYQFSSEIVPEAITGEKGNIIMPRAVKSKLAQSSRTRNMAEVFTPTWICNKMNNLVDEAWFGRSNVFNEENGTQWSVREQKIAFPDYHQHQPKGWESYIGAKRLEITCGEAPYLVSRYDTVTGEYIEVPNRIGLLDRKLRVVAENTDSREDWLKWATVAVQSSYGFEWQGDNILIARENLLFDVAEHYEAKFHEKLETQDLVGFAKVIAWNIWQMDGLKFVIPNSCCTKEIIEEDLFESHVISKPCEGCKLGYGEKSYFRHNGIYCKIRDWKENKTLRFVDIMKKGEKND